MSSELINRVIELTNIERANAGLQPLTFNSRLTAAAQDHSGDMAQDDFFSHTGVDGSSVASRVQDAGYEYSTVGENIAAGQRTAEEVVEGWMNSPGHRANILNANFTEIGIGYEYLANDTGSVNYNHYWTQVFGTSLNGNQSSVSGPLETEDSAQTPLETIDNSTDINEQPDLEVVEENSNSTPEAELEDSGQSEAIDEISDEVPDSNNTIPESESNLEVTEENSESTPELELENSGQFDTSEEITGDSFELDDSITFEQLSDSLINHSHSVALAGGDDAIAMFDSQGQDATQFIEYLQSNFSEIGGGSWLGTSMEGYDNSELVDMIESYADSNWGEVRSDMTSEVSDSFL